MQLTVNNEDGRIPLDIAEVTITRRLYRDGESEYLLNGKTTRLMDIQMLLAKAAFGKEGYSVIGQGQIDQILIASPEERKVFFDEATGVRPLQLKKEQALKKLAATEENLYQARMLEEEITPRLKSLTRQVRRLEQRGDIERDLRSLQIQYYGRLLQSGETEAKTWRDKMEQAQSKLDSKTAELKTIELEMRVLEKSETKPAELLKIQDEYSALIARKEKMREKEFDLKRKLLETKKEAVSVPVYEIAQILEGVRTELDVLLRHSERSEESRMNTRSASLGNPSLATLTQDDIKSNLRTLYTTVSDLLARLKGEKAPASATAITKELDAIVANLNTIDQELEKLRLELQRVGRLAEEKKQSFFDIQRKLSAKQSEVHALEADLNNAKIEIAKIETRYETLKAEAQQEMGENYLAVLNESRQGLDHEESRSADPQTILPEIQRLKRQLEAIGGVDAEVVKEYKEVSERYEFLASQIGDLENSLKSLVTLLEELDQTIKIQFETAFDKINEEFGNYFKILFGGGQAKLSKIIAKESETASEKGDASNFVQQNLEASPLAGSRQAERPSLLDKFTKNNTYRGVEISATPPGKKLKSIAMLSGGERAMTSIALLSAILALNPPPFVVLDEVDAALDESNSARFASILQELSNRTQFIVITHNRATMHVAQVLYGVTMAAEGISKILSLKLEEAIKAPAIAT